MRQLRPIVFQLSSMVCLSVHLSVTVVSPAKTAQPIEMQPESLTPFGLRTRVAKGTMYLMGPDPPWQGAVLRGRRGGPLYSMGTLCGELCKNG